MKDFLRGFNWSFNLRKCAIFLFFMLLLVAGTMSMVGSAEAACDCWCKTSAGAQNINENAADTDSCSDACSESTDGKILGCFDTADGGYTPDQSLLCWTQERCTSDTELVRGTEVPSVWGGQESVCTTGKGFCYAPAGSGGGHEVKLSVAIGRLSSVGDFGSYIVEIYKLLLALGAFLAVAVIMGAGFLWLTSGGSAAQIGRAQTMMKNAVVGLILLFSAYTIGSLVDPRLTQLGLFQAPKLQPILYLDNDCDTLLESGYELERDGRPVSAEAAAAASDVNPSYACGVGAKVSSIDNVTEQVVGVNVGFECRFTRCGDPMDSCQSTGSGYQCIRCSEVYENARTSGPTGIEPSEATCAALVPDEFSAANTGEGNAVLCKYYDGSMQNINYGDACVEVRYLGNESSMSGTFGGGFDRDQDTPAELEPRIDCSALARYAQAKRQQPSCLLYNEVYGQAYATRDGSNVTAKIWPLEEFEGDTIFQNGDYKVLDGVCSDDPCGFAPPGAGGCSLLNTDVYQQVDVVDICDGVLNVFTGAFPFGGDLCQSYFQTKTVSCVPTDFRQDVDQYFGDTSSDAELTVPIKDWNGNPLE